MSIPWTNHMYSLYLVSVQCGLKFKTGRLGGPKTWRKTRSHLRLAHSTKGIKHAFHIVHRSCEPQYGRKIHKRPKEK